MKKRLLVFFYFSAIFFSRAANLCAQPIQGTVEYQTAMKALGENNYEVAYESLSSLLANGRYRSAAMVELGRIRQKQAETEMSLALSHYNEAAELMNAGIMSDGLSGSEVPKALYDLARIYEEKLKNFVQAHNIYSKIIEDYPTYLAIDKVYFNLASCEEAMGMYEEAAINYQKVVSDYSYSTYHQVAREKVKKLSSGTSVAEAAIASQEEWADEKSETAEGARASLDLGDMQADAGKYKQAANAYKRAIQESNTQEEAIEAYRKLISMQDEKQKDYKAAAATIQEMLDTYPNARGNEDMIYRLGQIYETDLDGMKKRIVDGKVRYRKSDENSRKAIEYYDSVTDKYPDSNVAADAYLRKGKIYEDLKDYSEARASYQRFLKEFPQHNEAAGIREKLKDLEGY